MYKFLATNELTGLDARQATKQWVELSHNREASKSVMIQLGVDAGIIKHGELGNNAMLKVDEMYRQLDGEVTMSPRAVGELATLQRLMVKGQPVNIGKKIIESRRVGTAGTAKRSMSGQQGIIMDHTDSSYQACIVPIFDAGYGRDFRDIEAQRSEAFDAISEDAIEIEHTVFQEANDHLWNGSADLEVKGEVWLGLKADPSIATVSLAVRWDLAATAAQSIVEEAITATDVLRIANRCSAPLTLAVSPQIMSNWLRPTSTTDSTFGNILEFIKNTLAGRVVDIYEENELTDNEVLFYVDSRQGLHAKTGMAMSSYALPRTQHNSPYEFVKWLAVGFMAKRTHTGLRCALYGET